MEIKYENKTIGRWILALFIESKKKIGVLEVLGVAFLPAYMVLVSMAYASQYTVLPRLLADTRGGGLTYARNWYFGNPDSVPYFLDILGYAVLALSALAIGFKFLNDKGLTKAIGWILWLSAIAAILGFIGYASQNKSLEMGIVVSGVLTIPLGILVSIMGMQKITNPDLKLMRK